MDEKTIDSPQSPGTASLPGLSQPTNATVEAARKAVAQNVPVELNRHGKPKGHPGRPIKSGKWAKPRPGVPVAPVAQRSRPLLVEDEIVASDPPDGIRADFEPGPPAFDKIAMEPYAEGLVDLAGELNVEFVRYRILRGTKNRELSELIAGKVMMGQTERKLMKIGLIDCAVKYQIDLAKSPEAALIGGLVLWQLKTQAMVRSVVADYVKSHPVSA
jgi:hypothetical protein